MLRSLVIASATLLVLLGIVAYVVHANHSGSPTKQAAGATASSSGAAQGTSGPTCPLTGTPAPAGSVPARPAMAVKIGNNPSALPQSGLSHADVVFEEPIEGAITRLLAIFQCHEAQRVEPVRSTRWIDSQLLPQFGHPGFAFAGGILPDEHLIARSGVFDLDFTRYYDAYSRSSSRYAPNNLYTSTKRLWAIDKSRTPPKPIFSFSKIPPPGTTLSAVDLTWSSIASVQWKWDPTSATWVRYLGGQPETTAAGDTVQAANVVVETVHVTAGPYAEDAQLAHGVRSQTVGSGPALVMRNGIAITATWERSSIYNPTRFIGRSGAPISLAPGNTWVELLPTYGKITEVP
ncbi:MAG: DUF3048 domain-containing protein [Actinobacteria bacterium]|nr:DUF3048 domain-containing protein [Actinomycetota bacterium]